MKKQHPKDKAAFRVLKVITQKRLRDAGKSPAGAAKSRQCP